MPPKASLPAPTAQLGLQEWLKLLSGRGVDMRVAMALAAKIYKSHGTIERLGSLTPQKLAGMIEDKEARKTVLNAVKGLANGEAVNKKRGRDSDLLEPLAKRTKEQEDVPLDIEFHPIVDVEQLVPLTLTTNRAPVSTAWAYTLSRRLGFDHIESLSIAHVYVHISSLKHALMLGNILGEQETREARREVEELPGGEKELPDKLRRQMQDEQTRGRGGRGWKGKGREETQRRDVAGSAQPWVQLMRAKPIIERPDATCRAIQKGEPVGPGQAYLYITKAFKDYTPHVMGAMKLVADSYEPDELNRLGIHMYNEFKPDVAEWGQRGTLELVKVLDQIKNPIEADADFIDPPISSEKDSKGVSVSANGGDFGQTTKDELKDDRPTQEDSGCPLSPPLRALPESQNLDSEDLKLEATEVKPSITEVVESDRSHVGMKKDLTVEEYEALLDAEAEDMGGGFLEGGDIYGAEYQRG
ncbi:hypothetical protein I317_07370 [Kwoniella heveanensis CBS 569]|nr:hypothetical protein I317_07370 [Kwoniella heveanensis CBS 569]